MRWVTATYTLRTGEKITVDTQGNILRGPKKYVGKRGFRSITSNRFLLHPSGADLGQVVGRIERGPQKVDSVGTPLVIRSRNRSRPHGPT